VGRILLDSGIEPVVQMTLRDRNRIALQSDLLGAYALGVRNILCLSGDHPKFGNHQDAKPVGDLGIFDFIRKLRLMGEGSFFNGTAFASRGDCPRFFVGAVTNPFAGENVSINVDRLERKVEAGAEFIQTQPIFEWEPMAAWMEEVTKRNLHKRTALLLGAMPVQSLNMWYHLSSKVPGIRIPQSILSRVENAADGREEGIKICSEVVEAVRNTEGAVGVHLMSVQWEEGLLEVARRTGLTGVHPPQALYAKELR
jgi:methylenetetrahydrofolate reductase (NADPH)